MGAHVAETVEYLRPSPPSAFRAAVAEAVVEDGSYRENILMEQYYAIPQRLLAAAGVGRELAALPEEKKCAEQQTSPGSYGSPVKLVHQVPQ